MKTCRVAIVLAGISFAALAAGPAPSGGAADVDAAWMKAIKANDVAAVVACYAPDAVLWVPGAPEADGIDAIRATYEGMLRENTVKDAAIADTHYRRAGDVAAGWGRFTMTLSPKTGGPDVVIHGRFTEVVEKRGGKWLYVADHASEDPPAAPPAAH